jgi:hypothetical protein
MRHVDPVEAVRQLPGQPNTQRLRSPARDVAPASLRSRGQTERCRHRLAKVSP